MELEKLKEKIKQVKFFTINNKNATRQDIQLLVGRVKMGLEFIKSARIISNEILIKTF